MYLAREGVSRVFLFAGNTNKHHNFAFLMVDLRRRGVTLGIARLWVLCHHPNEAFWAKSGDISCSSMTFKKGVRRQDSATAFESTDLNINLL
jgi:hypothetical protein